MLARLPQVRRPALIAGVASLLLATPALAAPELLVNGNFDTYTVNGVAGTSSYQVNSSRTSTGATLAGWVNYGYTFLFKPGTADTTGSYSSEFGNALSFWGPGGGAASSNYSNNGFTATSPVGGNFVASDGAFEQGVLAQSVTGLTVGQAYNLSFYWAAAQQSGFSGPTQEAWTVYWADSGNNVVSTVSTQTVNTPDHGFTPWMQQSFQFVATTTTMSIAFLATGAPNGTPPFSLLDGVSLMAAPEPGTWGIVVAGLLGATVFQMKRRKAKPAPAQA